MLSNKNIHNQLHIFIYSKTQMDESFLIDPKSNMSNQQNIYFLLNSIQITKGKVSGNSCMQSFLRESSCACVCVRARPRVCVRVWASCRLPMRAVCCVQPRLRAALPADDVMSWILKQVARWSGGARVSIPSACTSPPHHPSLSFRQKNTQKR